MMKKINHIIMRTCLFNACAYFFLCLFSGCGLKKKNDLALYPIATISQTALIPFPLVQEPIRDISIEKNGSILATTTLFSIKYLERFYIEELDRLGWQLTQIWYSDKQVEMLFEQSHQRLLISLKLEDRKKEELTRITLYHCYVDQNFWQHDD